MKPSIITVLCQKFKYIELTQYVLSRASETRVEPFYYIFLLAVDVSLNLPSEALLKDLCLRSPD